MSAVATAYGIVMPPPGEEDYGPTTPEGGGGRPWPGVLNLNNQRVPTGIVANPEPVELRVAGVNDRTMFDPRHTMYQRTDSTDAMDLSNNGSHVVQVPGFHEAIGAMGAEPPMYGSTYRLEPVPADSGYYIGQDR